MRQFILGANVAYPASTVKEYTSVAAGAVGFFYNNNGVPTVMTTGAEAKMGNIVLGRAAKDGGPVVIPFHKNNFSYSKGTYIAATTFKATVTLTAPTKVGDYSLIVVRKGVKFNERSQWTAMVHVKDTTGTDATKLATAMVKAINANGVGSGVTATNAAGVVTITADDTGVDYNVLGADNLTGITVTVATTGKSAYGDAKYVQDLAEKAAADAGFEYTYKEAGEYLYPLYGVSPLAQPNKTDTGFDIFTLRFSEPRDVKTKDEVVNQIIQIALPKGTAAGTTIETICKALSGIATT